MEIIRTDSAKEFERYANECLSGHSGAVIHHSATSCVWTGQLPTYDPEAVKRHGFETGVGKCLGGTIVNFPDDVSVCVTTWGRSTFGANAAKALGKYLADKGISVSYDENDVLAEGKKVVSWAQAGTISGWYQSVLHVSMNMDVQIVKEICTKEMRKIPAALSELGINAEDVINIVLEYIPS